MKIFIAIPTYENIYPDTFKSVYGLQRGKNRVVFDFVRGYDIATARNNIAQQTIDEGADYVLMVDNDVVLPSNALLRLLEDPKDVCLGYYAHRAHNGLFDGRTTVCKLGEIDYTQLYTEDEVKELREKGEYKVKVHGGGMGCALIKADVFHRINYPWFDWVNYPGESRAMLSEDLFFSEQCGQAGIPVYMDTRVACGHMFRYIQKVK